MSNFGIHEDDMLMVTAFFDRKEHLGGKRVHKKMPADDNYPIPYGFRFNWVSKEEKKMKS